MRWLQQNPWVTRWLSHCMCCRSQLTLCFPAAGCTDWQMSPCGFVAVTSVLCPIVQKHRSHLDWPKSSQCYESTSGEFIALKLLCKAMSLLLLLLLLTSCFITLPFSLPFSGGLMHVPGVCLGLSSVLTCPGLQHILCWGSHTNQDQRGWSHSFASVPNSDPLRQAGRTWFHSLIFECRQKNHFEEHLNFRPKPPVCLYLALYNSTSQNSALASW